MKGLKRRDFLTVSAAIAAALPGTVQPDVQMQAEARGKFRQSEQVAFLCKVRGALPSGGGEAC